MQYEVVIQKKVMKSLVKMPLREQKVFKKLVDDLSETGPVQPSYSHYSKLGENRYHCHLGYHWVCCWYSEEGRLKVEVYYVGSRESAPY